MAKSYAYLEKINQVLLKSVVEMECLSTYVKSMEKSLMRTYFLFSQSRNVAKKKNVHDLRTQMERGPNTRASVAGTSPLKSHLSNSPRRAEGYRMGVARGAPRFHCEAQDKSVPLPTAGKDDVRKHD